MQKTVSLKSLSNGRAGVVERIELSGATKRRLIEMGITPGTRIDVLKRAPLGDPIEILLRGYTLTIRGADADKILVQEVRR
ncbi:MAG: ferrous iron transport protein A [Clostridia bacterium]|nr:ferrous iron transport protein A [Clostridia bacterium]